MDRNKIAKILFWIGEIFILLGFTYPMGLAPKGVLYFANIPASILLIIAAFMNKRDGSEKLSVTITKLDTVFISIAIMVIIGLFFCNSYAEKHGLTYQNKLQPTRYDGWIIKRKDHSTFSSKYELQLRKGKKVVKVNVSSETYKTSSIGSMYVGNMIWTNK